MGPAGRTGLDRATGRFKLENNVVIVATVPEATEPRLIGQVRVGERREHRHERQQKDYYVTITAHRSRRSSERFPIGVKKNAPPGHPVSLFTQSKEPARGRLNISRPRFQSVQASKRQRRSHSPEPVTFWGLCAGTGNPSLCTYQKSGGVLPLLPTYH